MKSYSPSLLLFLLCIVNLTAQAQLPSAGSYVWNAADAPKTFNNKLQLSFVREADGFPSFGTVVAGGGIAATQDGSAFQLYIPYNNTHGGNVPRIRMGLYNNGGWSAWQSFYTSANANTTTADWNTRHLYVHGNVGIGTTNPQAKLAVNGNIRAKEVKVEMANWPDYVFTEDYKLMPLADLEAHIRTHGHLPGIPTAKEAEAEGIGLAEMNRKLLEKVEELTLHLITLTKKVEQLDSLQNRVEQAPAKKFN